MVALSNTEFLLFKKFIYDRCGINIEENKAYLIETRLAKLLIDSGLTSFTELYNILENNWDDSIATKVIDAVTTNETLWFRDQKPWEILENRFMPLYIEKLRKNEIDKVRIWSAASSTGQEIYSTVMSIDSYLKKHGIVDVKLNDFEFFATDISTNVLEIAKKGFYDAISIKRGLSDTYRDNYFKKDGYVWEIDDFIKKQVKFEQFNLQNSFMFIGKFDLVFCRYVLIYFSDELRREIIQKMAKVLNKNGGFIIGTSEIYADIDEHFEKQVYDEGSYYTVKEDEI